MIACLNSRRCALLLAAYYLPLNPRLSAPNRRGWRRREDQREVRPSHHSFRKCSAQLGYDVINLESVKLGDGCLLIVS